MLDRGRRRRWGGDPYDDAGRRLLVALAAASALVLALVGLRVGYAAARALGLPPWPVGVGAGLISAGVALGALWALGRQ